MERILQFSGGKDSLALLYLMEDEWDDLMVMWCNPGAPHASTLALMDKVRRMVPHFIEVKGTQPLFLANVGYPSDIVPVSATIVGRAVEHTKGDVFVSAYDCCRVNLWQPMHAATKLLGGKHVYRGQKNADGRKSPARDGFVEDGITYHFPLERWSDQDVRDFLGDRLPHHYTAGEKTSRDCWNCTAYLDENVERITNLPIQQRMFVMGKLATLLEEVNKSRDLLAAYLQTECER
jgi:3'-phosphoadenosine 5'-phosphosulfate sulfotransferase (PAPS reductase)/FAD synthetase